MTTIFPPTKRVRVSIETDNSIIDNIYKALKSCGHDVYKYDSTISGYLLGNKFSISYEYPFYVSINRNDGYQLTFKPIDMTAYKCVLLLFVFVVYRYDYKTLHTRIINRQFNYKWKRNKRIKLTK